MPEPRPSKTNVAMSLSNRGESRQPLLFDSAGAYQADPCAQRHAGAETSIQAHDRVLPHKRAVYEQILAAVRAQGADGMTVHEVAQALETLPNKISGRLTELRMLGRLVYALDGTGARVRRGGAYALIVLAEGMP